MTREQIVAELQRLMGRSEANDNEDGFVAADPCSTEYLAGYRRGWRMGLEAAVIMLRRG